MLIYRDKYTCEKFPCVVFLCGNSFVGEKNNDKRSVLKKYIERNNSDFYPIILEENFAFKKPTQKYLSYDDIFLKNLFQVEQLASIFADKIIIIHETLSTAAELGMFAHDINMMKKICLLVPDDMSIEENKITNFIRLAYLNPRTPDMQIGERITYYPDIDVIRFSEFKSDYRTKFHNNEIGPNLGEKVLNFISSEDNDLEIEFRKNKYNKPCKEINKITYNINKELKKKIKVYIHPDVLRIQLFSLFYVNKFKKGIRSSKKMVDHINFVKDFYKNIILNTICNIEGLNPEDFRIEIELSETLCDLNQAIGYFIYMMQGINFITLNGNAKHEDCTNRKISISNKFNEYEQYLGEYIVDSPITSFGGLNI